MPSSKNLNNSETQKTPSRATPTSSTPIRQSARIAAKRQEATTSNTSILVASTPQVETPKRRAKNTTSEVLSTPTKTTPKEKSRVFRKFLVENQKTSHNIEKKFKEKLLEKTVETANYLLIQPDENDILEQTQHKNTKTKTPKMDALAASLSGKSFPIYSFTFFLHTLFDENSI